jgi:hypothetical protein
MIRRITLLLAIGVAVGAVLAAPAAAGRATQVSGRYEVVDFGTTTCAPLSETRLDCTTTGLASGYAVGDLQGTSTSRFRQVIDCARGKTVGHGSETFTGSIGGSSGTLTWQLWFTSDFDCATFFPSNLRIVAVPTQGTGGLAGVRGVLVFDDVGYRGVLG